MFPSQKVVELRVEELDETHTIFVNEEEYNDIVGNGNITLATEILRQQQERENYKKAFELVKNNKDLCSGSASSSSARGNNNKFIETPALEANKDNIVVGNTIHQDVPVELPAQESSKLWSHEATLMLIELYQKYEKDFDTGVKRYVWSKIARELSTNLKTPYNIQQCDTKWKGLTNLYKSVKKHNEQSGNNNKKWKYFDLMNNILFQRPEIQAPATCSSRTGLVVQGEKIDIQEGPLEANNQEGNNTTPSSTEYQSSFMRKRKQGEIAVERRHKEKMARQDRYLDLLERLTSAVEKSASTSGGGSNNDSQ